ncbi:hypothetical protein CLPUN_52400 [Clostridium puniceum]|uniref:3D domain-containing protein n=1 Tax=Clostridium puniceum TaxID=29367 RepID=A0A1S8SYK6_9CLOT|nr:3D domain-containing protein [Clostridium puniceum]OOM70325.1 hypothetical protein CLPUN_52400 [Clostridium puniceum]
MLNINMLMCLLSFLFIFNNYNISTITPFQALVTEVVEDNNTEMVHGTNQYDVKIITNPIITKYEKFKQEELEKEIQEKKLKEEEKKKPEYKEFILTFYTSLECENSSAGAVTCQNKPLSPGGVANNVIPQNTKIHLEGYGQVVVNDRGSDKYFGVDNRLDVYVPRESGESDRQYSRRVNNYGIQKVQGYIIK